MRLIRLPCLLAVTTLAAGVAAAQTTPEGGADLNALPAHPDSVVARPAPVRRRARRSRQATEAPPNIPADRAALRRAEDIAHGATSLTQAPTTNSASTGGPELKGDIMKSGPTGPQ